MYLFKSVFTAQIISVWYIPGSGITRSLTYFLQFLWVAQWFYSHSPAKLSFLTKQNFAKLIAKNIIGITSPIVSARIKLQNILAAWNSNSDVTNENSWGNNLECKSPDQKAEVQMEAT